MPAYSRQDYVAVKGGSMVQLPDTGGSGKVRQDSGHLWSAYNFPTSVVQGNYDFFQNGIGQIGQGYTTNLTERETNLPNSGRLPLEQSWVVFDIGIGWLSSVALADAQLLSNFLTLILTKPGYSRILGPIFFWPAGWGLSGMSTANNQQSWNAGVPSPNVRRRFKRPFTLNPGASFTVRMLATASGYTTQTLTAATPVWADLYGIFHETVAQS